jgi:hypothetical protein
MATKFFSLISVIIISVSLAHAGETEKAKPIRMLAEDVIDSKSEIQKILKNNVQIAQCKGVKEYVYVRTQTIRPLETAVSVKLLMPKYPSQTLYVVFSSKEGPMVYKYELSTTEGMGDSGFIVEDVISYLSTYKITNNLTNSTKALELVFDYEGASIRFAQCKVQIPASK